jgi:hypothetical protein
MDDLEVVEALLVAEPDQLVVDDRGDNHPNDLDFDEQLDGDVIVADQVAAAVDQVPIAVAGALQPEIEDVIILPPVANIFERRGLRVDSETVVANACNSYVIPAGWIR